MDLLFNCRNYVTDDMWKEVFSMAYDEVLKGRRHHIVVVLVDHPGPGDLPPQLEYYLRHHPSIQAHNYGANMDMIRNEII